MFLDRRSKVPKIIFASLMRSGNSFFRKLIEQVVGVATGSNLMNNALLNFMLCAGGLKGEQFADDRVWLIKTHFPYMYPKTFPFSGQTAIVLVRNPLDMLVSLF